MCVYKRQVMCLQCLKHVLYVCTAFMHYYDNPKGMIPTWLINWAAKVRNDLVNHQMWLSKLKLPPTTQTGVPQFLKMMREAIKGYPDYLKAEGKEWMLTEAQKFWGHQ